MSPDAGYLSDLEGCILAQLMREPGATTYEVMQALSRSPLAGLSASPGAIYPAVKRLRERDLIKAKAATTGLRVHERLEATAKGGVAIRRWIGDVKPTDLLPHDPLRAKLLFFDLLSAGEQKDWRQKVQTALSVATQEMRAVHPQATSDRAGFATSSAKATVRQRKALLKELAGDQESG